MSIEVAGTGTIRGVLGAAGVGGQDAATAGLAIHPEQTWSEQHGPRVTGYRSEHRLALNLRDLGAAGPLLGEVVAAGGDDVRLDHVGFEVADDAELRTRARQAAWADAERTARQLAELAGHTLGPVEAIREQTGQQAASMPMTALRHEAAAAVAVQPGSVAVEVGLVVRWSLARPAL